MHQMRRNVIRLSAGALVVGLVLTAAACGRQARQATGSPVTTAPRPSRTVSPAPTTPTPIIPTQTVGTWQLLPAAPIPAPYIRTSVWTGTEMLVFGRLMVTDAGSTGDVDVAAAYNPATNTWRRLSAGHNRVGGYEGSNRAVWAGSEMLVWGITDKAFDPATGLWRLLPEAPLSWGGPAVAVWTGRQMIGWGGGCCGDSVAAGLAYTPATDSWDTLPPSPLVGRQVATGAWTGRELVIAGGNNADGKLFGDAAAYNPSTRSWRRLPPMPEPRTDATAVWDGSEVLVVGGGDQQRLYAEGVAYNPSTNTWRRLSAMEYPRAGHVALWTGSRLLVWGGATRRGSLATRPPHGETYDPVTNRWSPLPKSPLRGRAGATAVWTGSAMIVWGGSPVDDDGGWFADGARYTPGTR